VRDLREVGSGPVSLVISQIMAVGVIYSAMLLQLLYPLFTYLVYTLAPIYIKIRLEQIKYPL
jgi:hypothetical protein